MKIYVFGNEDFSEDNLAIKAAGNLSDKFPEIQFINIAPNIDLPFFNENKIIIIDVIQGINKIELINQEMFDKLLLSPRNTVHDFDLGFQLKYLQKLGKLKDVRIIGIPQNQKIDYKRIQSILRKLVAQDMQGS
ncbi:MAG: hypothetical protein Q7R43_03620 [Candidatus Daviesbacteria bacterium]|nr:hypothetical protein [Candidatus Daviesbacteria bacterium]